MKPVGGVGGAGGGGDNLCLGKFTQSAFRETIEDSHLSKQELTVACTIYIRIRKAGRSGGAENI